MANVVFGSGNLPANYCWTGPAQYLADIVALLTGTVSTAGKVMIQQNAPGPADQDALWIKLVGGYMEGAYTYLGSWFRPHPIPPSSPIRQIYFGTEASLVTYDGGDANALSATTGAMWVADHSMDFKMPIGAGTNAVPYDGNAANSIAQGASITSGGQAGEERHILIGTEVGPHTHNMHQGLVQHGTADHGVFQNTTSDGQPDVPSISGGGNPASGTPPVTALSHQNLPPFMGCFFIQRTIRTYIQG